MRSLFFKLLLAGIPLIQSCGFQVGSYGEFNGRKIAGIITPLVGSIAKTRDHASLFPKAYAGMCTEPVYAKLFALESDGTIDPSRPLKSQLLGPDAKYTFDLQEIDSSADSSTKVKYLVVAEGCSGEVFKRPVTNYDSNQHIDAKTTVISEVINAGGMITVKLNEVEKKDVQKLLDSVTGTTTSQVLANIETKPEAAEKFSQIFKTGPDVLKEVRPEVNLTYPINALNELATSQFSLQSYHVNPNYSFVYRWKLDGVVKSTAPNWNYSPTGNSQGTHTVDVYVGQDDGQGNLDAAKPYFSRRLVISVNNSTRPIAPVVELDSTTPSPRTTNSVVLKLATGVNFSACDSFSRLAVTEGNQEPAPSDFSIACTAGGTQTQPIQFSSGDGPKTLKLWAIDDSGLISPPRSVNFTLDSTPPMATISAPVLSKGGETKNVSLNFSDATSGIQSASLSYSSDGINFSQLTTLTAGTSSYSWNVPLADSVNARLKLTVTDNAGLTTYAETPALTIDSTAPGAPAFSFFTTRPTSSSIVRLSVGSCADTAAILISELNLPPTGNETNWQPCSTTAGAHSFTVSGDGLHHVYVWAMDESGNISQTSSHDTVIYDTTPPVINAGPALPATLLKGGSASSVTWNTTDLTTVKVSLAYSDNNGVTWTSIATDLINSGSYVWGLPSLDSAITVKLTARDELGFSSVSTYAVTLDSTPPSVLVGNMPVLVRGGEVVAVTYTVSDLHTVSSLKLSYSSDGTSFGAPVDLPNGSTSANWTANSDNTSSARLKVIATDEVGNIGSGISQAFTIDSTPPVVPTITRTSALYVTDRTVTMTPSSCTDALWLLVNEGAQPLRTDANWVACSTAVSSLSYTIPDTTEGLRNLKVWGKDAAGNVSASAFALQTYSDLSDPVLAFNAFPSILQGGLTQTFQVKVTELHASAAQSITFDFFNGSSWSTLGTKTISNGPLNATTFSFSASLEAVNTTLAQVRASYTDLAGRTKTIASGLTVDTKGPTTTAITVNNGNPNTSNRNVIVTFSGQDLSNIDSFCLKYNQTSDPLANDSCWITLASAGIPAGPSVTVTNYPFQLGSLAGDYKVSAWFKDSYGQVTALSNNGSGTSGLDAFVITFTPDPAPVISNLIASSSDTPSSPLLTSDVTVPIGTDVYIRWKITDNTPIPSNGITLSYTSNDTSYTTIVTGISNSANGGCTIDANSTGCFKWTASSPLSSYYRIKLNVTDQGGTGVFEVANPLNTGNVKFLSGNTSLGIGGAATNAILLGQNESMYNDYHDAQAFVVTRTGYIFFRYNTRGLVYISPEDGIIRDIASITGTTSGDGGSVFSATFRTIQRIAIDYQDNILVWDYDRVRKINLSVTPWRITTLFGGGASTTDGAPATSANIGTSYTDQMTVTPNGRVYFNKNADIWYFDPSDSLVKKYLTLSGLGTDDMASWRATFDNSFCPGVNASLAFDKTTSAVTKVMRRMSSTTNALCGAAVSSYPYYNTNFNVSTGVASAPHPPQTPWSSFKFTGLDGNIYVLLQGRQVLQKYNPVTNTFTTVLGVANANGRCADGTPATSCNAVIMSAFVTEYGRIYFLDLGVLRMIDASGLIQTIAGQPRNFGIGFNPVSARYSQISFFEKVGNDIYVRNELENQIVKFSLTGGTLTHIAGNTIRGTPSTTVDATATPLPNGGWSMPVSFIVDTATNRLYHQFSNGYISYLDLVTKRWVTLATGFQDTGARVSWVGTGTDGLLAYLPTNYGTSVKVTIRLYNPSTNVSKILYGLSSNVTTTSTTICTGVDGTTCTYPHSMDESVQMRFKFDTNTNNWLITIKGQTSLYTIPSQGGIVNLWKTMSNPLIAYDYFKGASTEFIYYCSTSGGLFKRNLVTNTETALTLPISSMKCASGSLYYDQSRNSLVFAYKQNSLYGIAEYVNP